MTTTPTTSQTTVASDRIRLWRECPDIMVRELFHVEPDKWQQEFLENFPKRKRLGAKACKGPGKTAVLAWICWNFLLTRPHPKVAATSVSAKNLEDNLWTEMSKWQQKSPLLMEAFTWTKKRIFAKAHETTWWMSARNWSADADKATQADTLAGLHADYLLFVLDESGSIPDAVMAAAEAGLATGIETHLVQMGNPTALSGPLYRACTNEASMWYMVEITGDPDAPNRSPRVSRQWALDQIEKYGVDNPWVRVNVFGQFPPASLNALIGPDEVRAAMARHYGIEKYRHAPRVLGVDVALYGDDRTVIFPRQGLAAFHPVILREPDTLQIAGRVSTRWMNFHDVGPGYGTETADGCFVDNTGGWGAGVVDQLRSLGRDPVGVQFAGKPIDGRFANKRAEILFAAVKWVKDGGALPPIPELVAEMTEPTYSYLGDKILIEPKQAVKDRLGRSPDLFDALGLTFAFPVERADGGTDFGHILGADVKPGRCATDYDPWERVG